MNKIESSGSSIVEIKENQTIQKFHSSKISERIGKIMMSLILNNPTSYRIFLQKGFGPNKKVLIDKKLIYNCFDYIVQFKYLLESEKTIVWEKITPLNRTSFGLKKNFLQSNWIKIMYDILKALYSLKTINIIHNDTVLDNIGINNNNNFVLFDFDGSGNPEEKGKDFSVDVYTLKKSFKFYDVEIPEKIDNISGMIEYLSKKLLKTELEIFEYLQNLKIKYL